jgi:hypothetical protein
MLFFAGFVVGWLVAETFTIGVLYVLTTRRNRDMIARTTEKLQNAVDTQRRERMSVVRSTTDAERAMDHIRRINADRGGIPDSEFLS